MIVFAVKQGREASAGVSKQSKRLGEVEAMPCGKSAGDIGDGLVKERVGETRGGAGEDVGCGIKMEMRPEVARALDFADGETRPRVSLIVDPFFSVQGDAYAAFVALIAADVAEVVKQLDRCEHKGGTHGFGSAGVIDKHVLRRDFPFFQEGRDDVAQGRVTGAELFEPVDFEEFRGGRPGASVSCDIGVDFPGLFDRVTRAKKPHMVGTMMVDAMKDRVGGAADGDQKGRGGLGNGMV